MDHHGQGGGHPHDDVSLAFLGQLDQLFLQPSGGIMQGRGGGEGAWGAQRVPGLAVPTLGDPLLQLPYLPQELLGLQPQPQQQPGHLMPLGMQDLDTGPSLPQQQQQQQQQQQPGSKQQRGASMDKEAKQALARQKNREAQQRFRERQRAKLLEANSEYDRLAEEVERLRIENSSLAKRNGIMEKVLTVRDAMMRAFEEYKSVTNQEDLTSLEGQSARGLMTAIQNLPSPEDIERFASGSVTSGALQAEQQQQRSASQQGASGGQRPATPAAAVAAEPQQQQQQQKVHGGPVAAPGGGGDSGGSMSSGGRKGEGGNEAACRGGVPSGPAGPIWAGIKSGSAAGVEIDGSVLKRAESIPPPTNKDVALRIQQMAQPQDFIDYWRQWQVEMMRAQESGEAEGWKEHNLEDADKLMDEVIEMWWHTAQLKPSYMIRLIETGTRKSAAAEDEVSRSIAARIGPEMDEASRRMMRRAWQLYMKRLAKAAVSVSRWVQRLQQMAVPTHMSSLQSVASGAVEIAEITRHMRMAVEEEYLASMEFLANLTPALTHRQKLQINYYSAPYLPDWVSVAYHILRQEQQDAQGAGALPVALKLPAPLNCMQLLRGCQGDGAGAQEGAKVQPAAAAAADGEQEVQQEQ